MFYCRDVNSSGNCIPGSIVATPGSRSRLSILPEYVPFTVHTDWSWIAGVGGLIAAFRRSVDIMGSDVPEMMQGRPGRGLKGTRPGKFDGRSPPPSKLGWQIARPPC